MTQIRPTSWAELEKNISRLGYRFPQQVKEQIGTVRAIFAQGALNPFIAQIPNSPPLILVKGPLFGPTDPAVPRGAPPVEFVLTLSQEFPNAYPVLTIELPPQGNVIKNHPNVNTSGCVFLQSISAWNPRTSKLDGILKDLYIAFKNNFPFVPVSAPPPQSPIQAQPPMPQQTLAMGATINSALAATRVTGPCTAAPLPPAPQPQPHPQPQLGIPPPLAVVQQRPANVAPAYQSSQQYDFNKGDFEGMLAGAAKPPGMMISTPRGFGLDCGLITSGPHMPLSLNGLAPYPLPPVTAPTPDEQYRQTVRQGEVQRMAESQSSTGFSGFLKTVKGAAASAKNAVEDKVRDSVRTSDVERFNKLFPTMRHENLLTTYVCSTLVGNGTVRKGHVFVTSVGVHFTTKPTTDPRPEDPPRPPEFTCSLPLKGVVSLVLGSEHGRKWLHIVCVDGTVRSFVDVVGGWTASAASSFASVSLNDTPYERLYNWLDHAWRAAAIVPHPSYPYANRPTGPGGIGVGTFPYQQQLQPQQQPQAFRSSPSHPAPAASSASAAAATVLPPQPTQQQQQSTSVSEDLLCCICLERQKNCFLRPCGHVSTCMPCGSGLKTCPICRTAVDEAFQAFL